MTPQSQDLSFPDAPRLALEQLIGQLTDWAQDVLAAQGRLRGLGDPASGQRSRLEARRKLILALATACAGFSLILLDSTGRTELLRLGFVSLVGLNRDGGAVIYLARTVAFVRDITSSSGSKAQELASELARDLTAESTSGYNRRVSLSLSSAWGRSVRKA